MFHNLMESLKLEERVLLQQQINGHGLRFCVRGRVRFKDRNHFMLASCFSLKSAQTRLEIASRSHY